MIWSCSEKNRRFRIREKHVMNSLKENGIMDELSNMTIFIPSNEAVEDFRHDLQHLNSVDNERNTYNIDDGLSYRLFFVISTYFVTNQPKI